MTPLAAFVGHSFVDADKSVVRQFLDFFDHVKGLGIGFTWDHAEYAEPKELAEKVLAKIEGKNLFVAICTAKEHAIAPGKLKKLLFPLGFLGSKGGKTMR